MKVKPEHFKVAHRIANIKATCSTKQNFWGAVHRLASHGGKLILYTTDNSIWIEWNIPFEGEAIDFDVIIPEEKLVYSTRIEGGSLELDPQPGVLRLVKPGVKMPLHLEANQTYPQPASGENSHTWEMQSKPLVDSLKFLIPLVNDTNPNQHKSCITVYTSGEAWTGDLKNIGTAEGIVGVERDMSFKKQIAKALVDFLSQGSGDVRVTVNTRSLYI